MLQPQSACALLKIGGGTQSWSCRGDEKKIKASKLRRINALLAQQAIPPPETSGIPGFQLMTMSTLSSYGLWVLEILEMASKLLGLRYGVARTQRPVAPTAAACRGTNHALKIQQHIAAYHIIRLYYAQFQKALPGAAPVRDGLTKTSCERILGRFRTFLRTDITFLRRFTTPKLLVNLHNGIKALINLHCDPKLMNLHYGAKVQINGQC